MFVPGEHFMWAKDGGSAVVRLVTYELPFGLIFHTAPIGSPL